MSTDASENPIVDASENPIVDAPISLMDLSGNAPIPAPAPITMNDILSSVELIEQKETNDKATLESIGNITFDTLKAKLIQWAKQGFPSAYEIYQVSVTPPSVCSDGVTRDLADYITFCSGKSILEHVNVLQAKVTDMVISFANMGTYIAIVISKPMA